MRHYSLAPAIALVAVCSLLSCDHSATAPRLAQLSLDVVSGNGQTGVVGTELAPLIVKVTSGGNPVAQQVLNFRVVSGGGSVYGGTELTDNDGIAQELWTLGTSTDAEQRVEVRAVESSTGAAKVFATFTATALPGPAAQIGIAAGNQQTAHPASALPIAPAVRVTDQYGNPVPSVAVTFTPAASSGSVSGGTPNTATNGIATVGSWTLGSTCGSTNTLAATATGNGIAGNPAAFTARAGDCWTTEASMPTARAALSVGVVNGTLYAIGGSVIGTGVVGMVEAYNPATNRWTTKASMPTPRVYFAVGEVDGILYALGGANSSVSLLATVEAYDPATDAWRSKASMPTALACPGVAAIAGVLYVVGGQDASGILATVEVYDPVTDTWGTKASMPIARACSGVAAINGILYAVGGSNESGFVGPVEAYDPATDTWTTKASIPTVRQNFATGVVDGILYAAGGDVGGFCATTAVVEGYNPVSDTWAARVPMPTRRNVLSGGVVNGILYAVGGQPCYNDFVGTNEAYQR